MRVRSLGIAVALAAVLATTHAGHAEVARDRRPTLTRKQAVRAAKLRERGLEHYLRREYQLASDELMEAYRLDKRPETLLGWAEAVRASGDCELASRIYGRLLDKTSDSKLTEQAEAGLAACVGQAGSAEPLTDTESELVAVLDDDVEPGAEAAPPMAAPAPAPAPSTAAAAPAARAPSHTASYILLGSGGLLTVGGLLTYATASDGSDLPNATHAQVTSARSRGDWHRLIGASVAVTGATVALVGILRYRSENRAADRGVAVAPYVGSSGAGIALGGHF
jgi:hypothetical protein